MNQTSGGMLAVGMKKYNFKTLGGNFTFFFLPALGSRRTLLVSNEEERMFKHKTFVANKHILIQYSNEFVPVTDEDGCVE